MNSLYPLKFTPIIKDKIWGGSKLKDLLNKETNTGKAGESWEISGVEGDISVVSNGFLEGNTLEELIEIYMGDLVGDKVYEKFGLAFPLLIKYIDACDVLSIQVHPNDEIAGQRHNSYGKTEMWYIMQAEKGAELIIGFNQEINKEKYLIYSNEDKIQDLLNTETANKGDVYFLPAGRIHAIGKGILLAEIQQSSDITYRLFDFNRKDDAGKERELHTELAVDVIDYSVSTSYKTEYKNNSNEACKLVKCPYFTSNLIELDRKIDKDINNLNSFVIYMCLEGNVEIHYPDGIEVLKMGETVLIPSELENFQLHPLCKSKLLEVYIED